MKKTHRTIASFVALIVVYILLNYLFAVNPGPGVLIMWGIIIPFFSIVASFKYLESKQEEIRCWRQVATVVSLIFCLLGGATFFIVAQIWASV